MKTQAFEHVPIEIWGIIRQVCKQALKHKRKLKDERKLRLTLVNLDYPELKPSLNICISFSVENVHYTVNYMKHKVEVSNYISEDSGQGIDHYQGFNYTYTLEDKEEEGNLDSVVYEVKKALEEAQDIAVSNVE